MKKIYFVLYLIVATLTLQAQTGIIRGKVIDAETNEEIIGASVVLLNVKTMIGTATDIDGSFELKNIPEGKHSIQVSFISYQKKTIESIEVTSGNVSVINAALSTESTRLDEIVVTANVVRNSEQSVLVMQKKSANVLDGISAQQFSKLGDSDAASALKRVTGITVEGGKYIFVRGLSDRYTKIGLNGADIPGLDPNRNTVQMDLFPSNLINNIVVYKTFSPELPGSFTGGYVDIITRDIPETFTLLISSSAGYNPNTTFNDILLYEGGKTDWLGIDDGTRSLPSLVKSNIVPALYQTATSNQLLDSMTRSFNKIFSPSKQQAFLNHSHSLALGNQFSLFGKPLGILASLSYRRDFESYATGTIRQYERGQVGSKTLETMLDLTDESGTMEVLWGTMLGVSYKFSPNHKIGLTTLYNRGGSTGGTYSEGYDTNNSWIFQNRSMVFLERNFWANQLKGEHMFAAWSDLKVNWLLSATVSGQNEPDLRFFQNVKDSTALGQVIYSIASNQKLPVRYFREMNEVNIDGKVHFELPYQLGGITSKLKWGGSMVYKKRDFSESQYTFKDQNQGYFYFDGNIDKYLNDANIGENSVVGGAYGLYVINSSQDRNNYLGIQQLGAGYLMTDIQLTSKFRIITGVRTEYNLIYVESGDDAIDPGKLKDLYLLPALNATYTLGQNSNLRAAYTRTLAYPAFREVAAFSSFDYLGGYIYNGNPKLKVTNIDNFDLRWELFPNEGELLAASVFFKNFTNPIEVVIVEVENAKWENVDKGLVYGAEFEFRKRLAESLPILRHMLFSANVSIVTSRVDIGDKELSIIRSVNPDHPSYRAMYGQAPFAVNGMLSYKNDASGVSANLAYNVTGKKILLVGKDGVNMTEVPFHSLNVNVGFKLTNNISLKASVSNALNDDKSSTYNYDREYVGQQHSLGRTFTFSVSYSIN